MTLSDLISANVQRVILAVVLLHITRFTVKKKSFEIKHKYPRSRCLRDGFHFGCVRLYQRVKRILINHVHYPYVDRITFPVKRKRLQLITTYGLHNYEHDV